MTVAELIEGLSEWPADTKVMVSDYDDMKDSWDRREAEDVVRCDEGVLIA